MEGQAQLLKGINYGTYSFINDHLVTLKDNKVIMQIPLSKVSNTSVVNRQDVALELQTDEIGDEDVLCEMRFYIPSKADNKDDEDQDKEDKEDKGSDIEVEDKQENIKAGADILNEIILSKANLTQKASDIIFNLDDLPFIVPRGKYTCDLSFNSLRLHGPTFNHIIQYKNISKAFLLSKPDDVHELFVLGLDKPVRQGNTSYSYLVMQSKKDARKTIKPLIPVEQLEQQLNEKFKEEYTGKLHEVVAQVFKSIIKINIIIAGEFKSSTKHSGVKCSVKASEGFLFFLTKSLIFVPKPVIYMKLDDVRACEFHRLGAGVKLFDIILNLKNGQQHTFSGIDKKELEIITDYFNGKKISVKTVNDMTNFADELSEEEAEDTGTSGRKRVKPQRVMQDEEDEDEDEEDEEFIVKDDDDESDEEDEDFDEEEEEEKQKKTKKVSKKPE